MHPADKLEKALIEARSKGMTDGIIISLGLYLAVKLVLAVIGGLT